MYLQRERKKWQSWGWGGEGDRYQDESPQVGFAFKRLPPLGAQSPSRPLKCFGNTEGSST